MQTNKPINATSRDVAGLGSEKAKNKNTPSSANPHTTNVTRLLTAAQRSKPDMRDHREPDVWLSVELWLWRLCAVVAGFEVFRMSICHLWNAFTSGVSMASDATTAMTSVVMLAMTIRLISVLNEMRALVKPNDPSSATASLGCLIANRSATEPFAAAHG